MAAISTRHFQIHFLINGYMLIRISLQCVPNDWINSKPALIEDFGTRNIYCRRVEVITYHNKLWDVITYPWDTCFWHQVQIQIMRWQMQYIPITIHTARFSSTFFFIWHCSILPVCFGYTPLAWNNRASGNSLGNMGKLITSSRRQLTTITVTELPVYYTGCNILLKW